MSKVYELIAREFVLHQTYTITEIDKVATAYDLQEIVDGSLEAFDIDRPFDEDETEIGYRFSVGEYILRLFFDDGSLALNFVLYAIGTQTVWKVIYISQFFSCHNKHEV